MEVVLRRNSGNKGMAGKCYSKKYKSVKKPIYFHHTGGRLCLLKLFPHGFFLYFCRLTFSERNAFADLGLMVNRQVEWRYRS